jgi:two-component system phosphate regulon sensor histidine kinase PhoR
VRLSLRARLIAGYLVLVAVVGGATLWMINRTVTAAVVGALEARLEAQAQGVAQWLDDAGHPERLAPKLARVVAARVTIVGADGRVEGDSEDRAHVGRPVGLAPEVAAARRGEVGRGRRALAPDGPPLYLVAVPTRDGGAVRIAVPLAAVDQARADVRDRMILAAVIGLGAALLLGLGAIRAVTRPLQAMTLVAERLARGDYDVPAPAPAAPGDDELALLSRTLAQLAAELRARIGELTAERDLSAAVVEGLVEGVVAVDRAGRVVLANRAAAVLLGEPPAVPEALAAEVAAARGGAERDAELVIAGRAVRVTARPLAATGGAIAVLYDVTQLRALDRVRREFLASAAHELRTPVTAISGYAETLVNALLVLARLEARPERLGAREPVALAAVVADAAATARAAHPAARLTIDVADDAIALADRDGLDHVAQNLIDNAVLHGGGVARVTARRDGRRVVLSVADDGPGIAPEHHERIFERFFRVDVGRARSKGGSGLGLAIVRQQTLAMGGAIRVDSAPGQGTTFTVELDAA